MSNEQQQSSWGLGNWREAYLAACEKAKALETKLAEREKEHIRYASEATATENSLRASLRHLNKEVLYLRRAQEEQQKAQEGTFYTAPEVGIHTEGFLPNRGPNEAVRTLKVPGGWIYEFYSRKSFPHSDRASKTKLRATVFVPEGAPLDKDMTRKELEELRREAEELGNKYEKACETVAKMHEAAVGSVRGPIHGVVEDVANVRTAMLRFNDEAHRYRTEYGLLSGKVAELNERVKTLQDAKDVLEKQVWALRDAGK